MGLPSKKVVERHHSSTLVGRIVEKGFSATNPSPPTSSPHPTVLPFPVARHRSHGPHWPPLGPTVEVDNGDMDTTDYDPISSLALPINKKERRGLDFSSWKDLVPGESSAGSLPPLKKNRDAARSNLVEERVTQSTAPLEDSGRETTLYASLPDTEMDREILMKDSALELMTGKGIKQGSFDPRDVEPQSLGPGLGNQGTMSLVDDIDAENLGRLGQMSPDEIAEAQAELMEKMDPSVLEMLKKRGRDKMGSSRSSASSLDKERAGSKSAPPVEGAKSPQAEKSVPIHGISQSSGVRDGRSWKAWSERVEKVRTLRFSFDGDVVGIDPLSQPTHGGIPGCNQFNADNVTERDFLRMEGDPGAAGYTIKEAVALVRSMIPGQRTLALQLLASILDKALHNLHKKDDGCNMRSTNYIYNFVDWQAVWAYALGPEPEIALSLRIALDDNHNSVVLACAKVIYCILSCDVNENFFDISEKSATHVKDVATAPVFRSRPEINFGFLHGGFWKYNTKPSNILPFTDDNEDEESEGKHTIQNDVVISEQDVAAGLVRMGILPRICYLLEMDPLPSLEEYLVSILVALARHSPESANAIMRCPRLVQTVVKLFNKHATLEIHPSQIKSIVLLKVLSKSNKQHCLDFVKHGFFWETMWHLYKYPSSLGHWLESGREQCRVTSSLLVEQLRFWKVCIRYGYCISCFADLFPAMCLWLNPPTLDKLIEHNVLDEFASITREAYLVLEALSQRLPRLHSVEQLQKQVVEFSDDNLETWSWSHVVPMVELAIKWLSLISTPHVSSFFNRQSVVAHDVHDSSVRSLLWVISAVMHMLSTVLGRIVPEDTNALHKSITRLPWLPFFVPKVGLEIVKNGYLNFLVSSDGKHNGMPTEKASLAEHLCRLRYHNDSEISFSSVSCLHGLVCLIVSVDKCIQNAKHRDSTEPMEGSISGVEDKILAHGLIKCAKNDLIGILNTSMNVAASELWDMQSFEIFGRGGPAPGIGVGWGSPGGGFWSTNLLLAQVNAQIILNLLEIFPILLVKDFTAAAQMESEIGRPRAEIALALQRINSVFSLCLLAGPNDRDTLKKALDILLQAPVLNYLNSCLHNFQLNEGLKSFRWRYEEEDYLFFSKILHAHFRNRWLSIKEKSSDKVAKSYPSIKSSNKNVSLETIDEELEESDIASKYQEHTSLLIEWAHQRMPLPVHWFLSATIAGAVGNEGTPNQQSSSEHFDAKRSGLFLLLGLEAISYFLRSESVDSPILRVPLVWKLHALSLVLIDKMDVLEEEKSRDVYETLQEVYGQHIDHSRVKTIKVLSKENDAAVSSETFSFTEGQCPYDLEFLNFQTEIHESYPTFVETFVEQFGAVSYGDVIYGRQVALYLHRSVEAPVRLSAWNALSNTSVLEHLPPLEKCFAGAKGYLDPIENNEAILEAYVKSWVSGSLNRAAARGSISFTLALHHLSCFIFHSFTSSKLPFRNKLARSVIRSCSRKQHNKAMSMNLIQYKLPSSQDPAESSLLQNSEIKRRFDILSEACEGSSSLLAELENLKPSE